MPQALIVSDGADARSLRDATRAWREEHAAAIEWCYRVTFRTAGARRPALLVSATLDALARLPAGLDALAIDLPVRPVLARAGIVRNVANAYHGAGGRGMSHFAPGALVYCAGPYSGDGYERTYMVGPDRDTGRYVAVLGPTRRLKRWHVAEVTHPAALYTIATSPGAWDLEPAVLAALPREPPPVAWQPPDAWARLVARFLAPERPLLAQCVAALLGCDLAAARAMVDDGSVGTLLADLEKGRYRRGAGSAVVRAAAPAWELLAPPAWLTADAAQRRAFARPDLGARPGSGFFVGSAVATRRVPRSVSEVVALASAPESVATAEALAAQIGAAVNPRGAAPRRVVWHVMPLEHAQLELARSPWRPADAPQPAPSPTDGWGWVAMLRKFETFVCTDDDAAAARHCATARDTLPAYGVPDLFAPLLDLLALGYALIDATPDAVHLLCPAMPRPARRAPTPPPNRARAP